MSTNSFKKDKLATSGFINKLSKMIEGSDELIQWSDDGASFIITRCNDFAKDSLPRFFKHDNFQTFVRQLNMYGFHKVRDPQQGTLRTSTEPDRWEFCHTHFQRGKPDLFKLIQRKKGSQPSSDTNSGDIAADILAIKKQQTVIESNLKQIQMAIDSKFKQADSDKQALLQEIQRMNDIINTILESPNSANSTNKEPATISRKRSFSMVDVNDTECNTEQTDDIDREPTVAPIKKAKYGNNTAEKMSGCLPTHQVDNGNGSTTLSTMITHGSDFLNKFPAPQTVSALSDESSSALPNVANVTMAQESINNLSQQINILESNFEEMVGSATDSNSDAAGSPGSPDDFENFFEWPEWTLPPDSAPQSPSLDANHLAPEGSAGQENLELMSQPYAVQPWLHDAPPPDYAPQSPSLDTNRLAPEGSAGQENLELMSYLYALQPWLHDTPPPDSAPQSPNLDANRLALEGSAGQKNLELMLPDYAPQSPSLDANHLAPEGSAGQENLELMSQLYVLQPWLHDAPSPDYARQSPNLDANRLALEGSAGLKNLELMSPDYAPQSPSLDTNHLAPLVKRTSN